MRHMSHGNLILQLNTSLDRLAAALAQVPERPQIHALDSVGHTCKQAAASWDVLRHPLKRHCLRWNMMEASSLQPK